jgi:hypothetical protein
MAREAAFQPMGKTYKGNATTTTQTITISADAPCAQICVANHQPTGGSGQPVYFVISSNSSITVTAPSNGSAQYALVSVPGTTKVFTMPGQVTPSSNMYIAFIADSGTSECYFTPGEGI